MGSLSANNDTIHKNNMKIYSDEACFVVYFLGRHPKPVVFVELSIDPPEPKPFTTPAVSTEDVLHPQSSLPGESLMGVE